jgi:hypothetical protein
MKSDYVCTIVDSLSISVLGDWEENISGSSSRFLMRCM